MQSRTASALFLLLLPLALTLAPRRVLGRQQADALPPVAPAPDGTRGPYEVAFTPDGTRALVTEWDEGTLAVVEVASGKVLRHVPTGGEEPTGVAVSRDGNLAVVTNSFSGSVAFVDLRSFSTATMPLTGMPWDVVLSPDGGTAYVSVSQLDQVAVVDVARRAVTARWSTGRRPHALALSDDGRSLAAANLQEGSVSFFALPEGTPLGKGPTTAVNLRGVALFPDGRRAYCVGQRAQNERPTETPIGIWSNQAFRVHPGGGRNGDQNLWLDLMGQDVSDPDSVVLDSARGRALITCTGGHSVNAVPLAGRGETLTAQHVGAGPRGLALSPDGKELWVACQLSNEVSVVDAESLRVTRRIPLGPPSKKDPHLLGRFLFHTATITRGEQFSCASCHPDGNTDGIAWKFVHVPDWLGKETNRNVRGLRGPLAATAPFRWSGHDAALETFVQEEVAGLLQTPPLPRGHVEALAGYLRTLRLPQNPFRQADGTLTEAGGRGQALFEGKAGCVSCHTGPAAGGGKSAWVGTTPEGKLLDVPHLAGVYDTDPYLHDGRATTLEEVFTRHNPSSQHGNAHLLSPTELQDLLAYVRQL